MGRQNFVPKIEKVASTFVFTEENVLGIIKGKRKLFRIPAKEGEYEYGEPESYDGAGKTR